MKIYDTCPLCGHTIEVDRDMMDNTVMELHILCSQCEYSYDYVTGAHHVFLPFKWNYRDTPQNRAIEQALYIAEKSLREAMGLSDNEEDK